MLARFALATCIIAASCNVTFAQGNLTRTSTYTSSSAYAWMHLTDEDSDSDQGTGNTSASALAEDYSDPSGWGYSSADVNSLAGPANQTYQAARVQGNTSTNSILSGGIYDHTGTNWQPGTIQSFIGSVETNNTVVAAGTVEHFVNFAFNAGSNTAVGSMYAWATIGNHQVTFSWSGGDSLTVTVYVDGSQQTSFDIDASNGLFTYVDTFDQTVSAGEAIDVDVYCVLVDDRNYPHRDKNLALIAAAE